MLEQPECIYTGPKDKESVSLVIDNIWGLVYKSKLQPTHQQDMTRVIMMLNGKCVKAEHLELDNVLNQIIKYQLGGLQTSLCVLMQHT
jgi:hypothetical protein